MKAAYRRLVATAKRTGAQGRRVLEASRKQATTRRRGAWPNAWARSCRGSSRGIKPGRAACPGERPGPLGGEAAVAVRAAHAGDPAVQGGQAGGVRPEDPARRGGGRDHQRLLAVLEKGRRPGPAACLAEQPGQSPGAVRPATAGCWPADRGISSAANERLAKEAGVKHVALPHVGKAPPPDRRAEEKGASVPGRGYKFRAGIEGRIHVR